jgi:hypothetical protein
MYTWLQTGSPKNTLIPSDAGNRLADILEDHPHDARVPEGGRDGTVSLLIDPLIRRRANRELYPTTLRRGPDNNRNLVTSAKGFDKPFGVIDDPCGIVVAIDFSEELCYAFGVAGLEKADGQFFVVHKQVFL